MFSWVAKLLLFGRLNYQYLDFTLDLITETDLDGKESDFLDRPFHANHFRVDHQVLATHGFSDLLRSHRAVEMPLFVGIGVDGDGRARDLFGQDLKVGNSGFT